MGMVVPKTEPPCNQPKTHINDLPRTKSFLCVSPPHALFYFDVNPSGQSQSNTQGSPELSKLSMLKSWSLEVDQRAAMPPPHWLARVSMSSSSRHQNSLGHIVSLFELTRLYTLLRRYHIGESLIPSVRHYLRFIDAEEKVANYGFAMKVSIYRGYPARDSHFEARVCYKV